MEKNMLSHVFYFLKAADSVWIETWLVLRNDT